MLCGFSEGKSYPCGQCFACRLNRQRKWLLRLLCESTQHSQEPLFVTLTYKESPTCVSDDGTTLETLRPADLTDFLKRLRWHVGEKLRGLTSAARGKSVVRYYACGEYGTKTRRPHYHAILFGQTQVISPLLETTWSNGFVTQRPANAVNMAYSLKYVLKDIALPGDHKEQVRPFARMSLRPPLGTSFAPSIAKSILGIMSRDRSPALDEFLGCLPPILRIEGKILPLDRTMRRAVTNEMVYMGMPEHLVDLVFPRQEIEYDAEKAEISRQAHRHALAKGEKPSRYPI